MVQKNNLYLRVLLIFFLCFTLTAGQKEKAFQNTEGAYALPCDFIWSQQNSGVTSVLNTVKAVNENTGWAAGTGVVIKTTNGGFNWIVYNTAGQINGAIYCMDATDENTAWVSTSDFSTYIFKTSNGGNNWVQVFIQSGGFIDGIQMLNPATGYALGDPVGGVWTLLKTTNGGNNWIQMPSAPVQYNNEAGFNNTFCIVNNSMWFATNNTQTYISTNLGLNWASSLTPGLTYCFALHFNNDSVGMAAGSIALKTTNGGLYWMPVTGTIHGTGDIFGTEGYAADNFWIIRDSLICSTTDGGNNWTEIPNISSSGDLYAINFAVSGGCPSGWVVSSTGKVYSMQAVTGVKTINNKIPGSYSLEQNYPNPFNPSTKIKFSLPLPSKGGANDVRLKVYDILGREVAIIVNEELKPGTYEVEWNASNLSSGIYYYTLQTESFSQTRKMILLR